MKVAVVGHIEWGKFANVEHVPVAGEIILAKGVWEEVAGGGSVAAMQLAKLNGSCVFFTAVGDDEAGAHSISQLQKNGVEVYATVIKNQHTKSIFVYIDEQDERTITVMGNLKPSGGSKDLPWEKLAEMDAVYFVSGDENALKFARHAKVLVSTARILPLLRNTGIQLDGLVSSAKDSGEVYHEGELNPAPSTVVITRGVNGGDASDGTTYRSEIVANSELVDTYGCGDSFAAGLTFGLAGGATVQDALKIAALAGADAAKRRGAFGN